MCMACYIRWKKFLVCFLMLLKIKKFSLLITGYLLHLFLLSLCSVAPNNLIQVQNDFQYQTVLGEICWKQLNTFQSN